MLLKADKLQAAASVEQRQAAVAAEISLHQQVSSNEKQISSLEGKLNL